MYQTMFTQAVRCVCDHCGEAAGAYTEAVKVARHDALAAGYYWHGWEQDGCYREVCLCPGCYGRASDPRPWEEGF